MLKCIPFTAVLLSLQSILLSAQTPAVDIIDWEQWESAAITQNEGKTLIYVYADWCTLCKKLEEEALTDTLSQQLINSNFTLVGLNAQSKEDLSYQGEEYSYVRKGSMGYHELAAKLLEGRLAFPSLVFLDE